MKLSPLNLEDKVIKLIKSILANPQQFYRVLKSVQLILGIGLILFSFYIGRKNVFLIWAGEPAQGTIVGFEQVTWTGNSKNISTTRVRFLPIVQFQINDRVVKFKDVVGSISQNDLNASTTILYDSTDPESAIIKRPIMNWIPWGPMLALGLFLVLISLRKPTNKLELSS